MWKSKLAGAIGAIIVAAWSPQLKAAVLYSQPTDFNSADASQNDTSVGGSGNFATTYDNFTLGSSAQITTVQFVGSYFNPPTQGTITGFTLQIWSNDSGQPGASIYSVHTSVGALMLLVA